MRNRGTEFESILDTQHQAYEAQGRAVLEKLSQPIRVFGPPGGQKVVYLKNPFLDFTGTWKEKRGRSLHIEAKVTSEPRLALNSKTGLKVEQLLNLRRWEAAGAAVGVLWHHLGQTRLLTLAQIDLALAEVRGSVRFEKAYRLHQTSDLVFWDYLLPLAALYP